MHLSTLAAEHFRNLEPFRIEPNVRFNLIEGRNGQGKTNLLEAVYLLSAFRSQRDTRTGELVAFGAEQATIYGEIVRREVARTVELQLKPEGKRVVLDGKQVTRLPASLAHLNAVCFGPDDLELTKAGPEVRRRFLDRATYAIWPEHLIELRAYHEALKHRNRVLREAKVTQKAPDFDLIEAFEAELARRGALVQQRRHFFLQGFAPHFEAAFGSITEGEHRATITHQRSGLGPAGSEFVLAEVEHGLIATLAERRGGDLRLGYSRYGPHADELVFDIDQRPARLFASQGQHRAFVLALKIAELLRIYDALGVFPVFLLDDVSSELDERRNALLMQTLDRGGGQVFITTTDRRWIRVADATVYRLEAGRITAG